MPNPPLIPMLGWTIIAQTIPSVTESPIVGTSVVVAALVIVVQFALAVVREMKNKRATAVPPGHAASCIEHGQALATLRSEVTQLRADVHKLWEKVDGLRGPSAPDLTR